MSKRVYADAQKKSAAEAIIGRKFFPIDLTSEEPVASLEDFHSECTSASTQLFRERYQADLVQREAKDRTRNGGRNALMFNPPGLVPAETRRGVIKPENTRFDKTNPRFVFQMPHPDARDKLMHEHD